MMDIDMSDKTALIEELKQVRGFLSEQELIPYALSVDSAIEALQSTESERVTLRKGDYTDKPEDDDIYHTICKKFIEGGAVVGEYEEDPYWLGLTLVGWGRYKRLEGILHSDNPNTFGKIHRYLTNEQVLNAKTGEE